MLSKELEHANSCMYRRDENFVAHSEAQPAEIPRSNALPSTVSSWWEVLAFTQCFILLTIILLDLDHIITDTILCACR